MRDTQFATFAKLVDAELTTEATKCRDSRVPYDAIAAQRKIIARRAYDLVMHTIGYSAGGSYEGNYLSTGNPTGGIPDLTEFPKET